MNNLRMKHEGDGHLTICSAYSGECVLDLPNVDIPTADKLLKAISDAEYYAAVATKQRMVGMIAEIKSTMDRMGIPRP